MRKRKQFRGRAGGRAERQEGKQRQKLQGQRTWTGKVRGDRRGGSGEGRRRGGTKDSVGVGFGPDPGRKDVQT
jgi:hypothetical protein